MHDRLHRISTLRETDGGEQIDTDAEDFLRQEGALHAAIRWMPAAALCWAVIAVLAFVLGVPFLF